ncbi:MAG: ChaN family lipoprotein [Planctomycetes bacterium]|nr:ChaN family lipoprotein [Planctomycetota bacterium]
MTRCRFIAAAFACLLTTAFVQAQAPEKIKIVEATLRQLEKEIAEVRGLAFKNPVAAKVIARPKAGAKGVQGYYDIKEKTLYLYDDIAGNYERGVLIHEMVHALQDQHFGLAKLHQETFGTDAELAMAALIEGDATFTMIEVLKKEQPKVEMMLKTSLEKAKNLRNAFLYGLGARYVKGIKDKNTTKKNSGWAAVDMRYRFPPRTTAAILNPAAHTIDLGPGRSVGAFGLIELLGKDEIARSLAISAAGGWIGDRVAEDGAVKAWQLAFDTADHADRFRKAYEAHVSAKSPSDKRPVERVHVAGTRVSVIEAPNEPAYRAAFDRLEGEPTLVVYSAKERRQITFGELTDRLLNADMICIGESHDNVLCHRVQLQIIKALHARDARLGVGMEMFQRPYQTFLDQFIRGDLSEDEMLKHTEYRTRWGFHWSLYQPIVDFCRRNSVPLAALNVAREMTAKISKGGYKSLSDEDKKTLGPIDYHVKVHRDYWYETLAKMHGNTKVSEDQKERSYQVMTTWDEYMGASAAMFQTSRNLRRMVVLAGSGHIDLGFGIPNRAVQRTGGKAATVHIAPGGDSGKLFNSPPTDYVVIVR